MTPVTALYGRKASGGHINWITAIAMSAFHVGAIAAFFYIDAGAILAAVIMWFVAGSLGIGMAYHRLLTHRGYKTSKWVEYFLTTCGTLALEGGPIFWVATHRIHHQHSDHEGDPHSPREGTYWAHMGWIFTGKAMHHDTEVLRRYVPDLSKDPVPRRAHLVALGAAGGRRPRVPRLRRHSRTCSGPCSSAPPSACTAPGW